MTQPTHTSTSRTPPQAVRPADPTAVQPEGGATAPNYSSFGLAYATIDPRRQVQQEVEGRFINRMNIQKRYYEFVYQNIVQKSMDSESEVPVVSVPRSTEDCSRLQH